MKQISNKLEGHLAGIEFRKRVKKDKILALIGVYDVFSAKIAAMKFEGVFCSGFSFAASFYGLPDIGYVNWSDMTNFATRVRHAIPHTHILVDMDDGFGDEVIAAYTVRNLETNGISAVVIEDQRRPRRCGHFTGKMLLPREEFLVKLKKVIKVKESIFIIARTDAIDYKEGLERAIEYAEAGADGVMIEAVCNLDTVKELVQKVKCPVVVNQLYGGKTPNWSLCQLEDIGVSIAIYSTPCLFASQYALEKYLDGMKLSHMLSSKDAVTLKQCNKILIE